MDTSQYTYPYQIKVFRISLSTLQAEPVIQILSKTKDIDPKNLELRNIDIFFEGDKLSFYRQARKDLVWVSDRGAKLGIDDEDHLYYIKNRWWRKRLFKVPREPLPGDFNRYQFDGGVLSLGHLRWLPGSRYAIMGHNSLGIIILEPATGKMGQLVPKEGFSFGWFEPILNDEKHN
jgi:hypothetical protein